jgi:sterol desaturase/sphingolipid hydroxylase (fatty acid hydroxylase superfamily)
MFPLLAWPIHKALTLGGRKAVLPKAEQQATEVNQEDPNEVKEGWSQMHFGRQLPSWKKAAAQVWGAYALYDFMFYVSHRALHSKYLYQAIHKQHHQFAVSIGIASSYQHVLEGAAQMLNWYLPVGVAGYIGGGIHISTVFAYNCLRWVETVDAHCGYHFPWSPFAFLPLFGGAIQHDFHHSGEGLEFITLPDGTTFAEFGNYGASVVWDYVLGTFSPEYTEYRSAILEGRTPGTE